MPYDPRMLQMARAGIGMMGPEASPFDRAQQPKQWWDQPPPQPQQRPDDSNDPQPANQPKKPPSLLDMMMSLGRMTPQQYNQRMHGGPADQQQGAAQVSPWAWLGGLGGSRP